MHRRNDQTSAHVQMEPNKIPPGTQPQLQRNLHTGPGKVPLPTVRSQTGGERRNGSVQKNQHAVPRTARQNSGQKSHQRPEMRPAHFRHPKTRRHRERDDTIAEHRTQQVERRPGEKRDEEMLFRHENPRYQKRHRRRQQRH